MEAFGKSRIPLKTQNEKIHPPTPSYWNSIIGIQQKTSFCL